MTRPIMALALAAAWISLAPCLAHAAPPARPATEKAAAKAPQAQHALPWIEDDWPRAVALAKQRKVPIFVESWAPW